MEWPKNWRRKKKKRIRKQPKCLSTDERIKKWVYTHTHTHTMEYSWEVLLSVTKSCLALCNPTVYRLTGSSVHGIIPLTHWSRLPFLSPGDLPDPGIEPACLALAGGLYTTEPPGKATVKYYSVIKKHENFPSAATWMDSEGVTLSEISQTYYMLSFVCRILKLQ